MVFNGFFNGRVFGSLVVALRASRGALILILVQRYWYPFFEYVPKAACRRVGRRRFLATAVAKAVAKEVAEMMDL